MTSLVRRFAFRL